MIAEYGRGKHALPTVRLVRTATLQDGSIVHATRSWYGRAWYDAVRIDQQQGGEGSETLTLYARVVAIYQYGPDLAFIHIGRCRRYAVCRSRWLAVP